MDVTPTVASVIARTRHVHGCHTSAHRPRLTDASTCAPRPSTPVRLARWWLCARARWSLAARWPGACGPGTATLPHPKDGGRSCAPVPRPPWPVRAAATAVAPVLRPHLRLACRASPEAALPSPAGDNVTGGLFVRSLDAMAAAAVAQHAESRRALGPWAPALHAGPGHTDTTTSLAAVEAVPRTWGP